MVVVDVEFCGTCGYYKKFEELATYVKQKRPELELNAHEGRRASFEIKVDGALVHSKLSTLAYPDYDDLLSIVKDVEEGREARTCKQQPITSCTLS